MARCDRRNFVGMAACAAAFVLLGANRSAFARSGSAGTMLLQTAATGDAARIGELLHAGAPIEARDDNGRTALLLATRAGHAEAARLLIDAGADVNAKDSIQDTPFLYAGAEGRNDILTAMLATGRTDLEDTNRYGGTALIPAAHHGHPETVRILLDTAIKVDHVNKLGWTALLEAVILGDGGPTYQEIVRLLLDAGARQIPDRDGHTPLDHARDHGFREIAELLAAAAGR